MTSKLDFQTVKNIKTPGRFTDALVKGLHIWVKPNLNKYWIFRYTHQGKQHNISLGSFPTLTIAEARIKAQEARDELDKGANPVLAKNASKALKEAPKIEKVRFKEFAHACIQTKRAEWTNQKHGDQWEYTLEEFAYLFSRNGKKLSNMAMPMALRKFDLEATVHGFRSSFRDWVSEETNHPSEVAEMALAHTIANTVERAYSRKDLLEKRRLLLNDWEEYCNTTNQNVPELKVAHKLNILRRETPENHSFSPKK